MGIAEDWMSGMYAPQPQQQQEDDNDAAQAAAMYSAAENDPSDPGNLVYRDVAPGGQGDSLASRRAMGTAAAMRKQVDTGYAGIEAAQQKQADAVRDAIRSARQRLLERPPSTSQVWLNIASALGRPTMTGTFGEGVSNAAQGVSQGLDTLAKERYAREDEMAKYDTALAQMGNEPHAMDSNLLNTKLGLLKLQLQGANALDIAATRHPGGTGSGVPTSAISKLAAEEQDPNLSPLQRQSAHDMRMKMLRPPRDPNAQVQLTTADNDVADRVAKYDLDPMTALSRIGSEKREAFLQRVFQTNPEWKDYKYKPRNIALAEMASSSPTKLGGRLSAWGSLIPHMVLMEKLSDALDHGNSRHIASLTNAFHNEFGGSGPISLRSAVELWAPEIERAITAGQGSAEDRDRLKGLFDGTARPSVMRDQIEKVMLPMVASKVDNQLSNFYSSIPDEQRENFTGYAEKKLSKETRRLMVERGLLPDYKWDLGDLGTTAGAPGKPQFQLGKSTALPTGGGAAPAAPAPTKLTPNAQSWLDKATAARQGGP